jgi:hypothetical protein
MENRPTSSAWRGDFSLSKKLLAFLTGFNNAKTFARQSRTKVIASLSSILALQGFRGI